MENLNFSLSQLLLVAALTEAVVQIVKAVAVGKKLSEQGIQIISMLVGITLCFVLSISIFKDTPQATIYLGSVFAGAICSRGSNFIHDLMKKVGTISAQK